MTMEDITLNVYIPSKNEEVENIKKKKFVKKKSDTKKKNFHPTAKESTKSVEGLPLSKFSDDETSFTRSTTEKRQVQKKLNKKLIKKNEDFLTKTKLDGNKTVIKKNIDGGFEKENNGKMSLAQRNNEILDIDVDDNVEPVYEPLFSAKTYDSLGSLHPHLVSNLEKLFGITTMTVVQQITIPVLLSRKDALIRSQTGSGKTLAYAVPILDFLQSVRPKISRSDGVKALIVLPTRELALQTYEYFQKLTRAYTWLVPGLLVGGEKRKSEKARLRKGITILIGTPGRLLDHTRRTLALSLKNVQWLVLDEADKLLDLGYEEAIGSLLEVLREQVSNDSFNTVQTVLLSATLTPGVERLAGLALEAPVRLDASENASSMDLNPEDLSSVFVIPNTIDQKYVIVPAKLRLVVLAATVIHHCQLEKTDKVLIFMATLDMVDFYTDLMSCLPLKKVSFFKLHGNMTQVERTEVFKKFRSADSGVLISTDVGARGLDLPKTDVIIQLNAPCTPTDYVHRVGRTARVGSSGTSILFLDSSEMNFLQWLSDKRIKLKEENMETYLESLMKVDFDGKSDQNWRSGIQETASALQLKFESAVMEDKKLHEIACQAYRSWVRFYASYPKESRTVFCFKQLHLGHHAKSFALKDPPSKIGGIGKPAYLAKREKTMKRKKKDDKLKITTMSERTKRLITSEFDSGIKFKRKKV